MSRGHGGIAEGRVALQLLDHGLVLVGGLHAGDSEGHNLQTPQIPPFGAENVVECLRHFHGVAWEGGVADAHLGDSGKSGLEGGHQLGFQLAVNALPGIFPGEIAADVLIKQHGVADPVGILAEAADGNIGIQTDVAIHHPEGNRAGGAVLIADQLLGIEIVHPLILGRLTAEGEAFADGGERLEDALPQIARKDAGLGGGVVCKFARLGAELRDPALIHNHHALAVGHGDDGAVGNDVVASFGVAGTGTGALFAIYRQHVGGHGITIKILLPLVGQDAAHRTGCRFDQTHCLVLLPD